jgi:hypothetical protein
MNLRRLRLSLTVLILGSAFATFADASEFGVGTYRPGLMDLFAGYLPPPGTTLVKNYFLFQNASTDARTPDGRFGGHAHTLTYTAATFAGHLTKLSLLGTYWGFGTIIQFRIADQTLRTGPVGGPRTLQTSTAGGLGDLIVAPLLLGWNFGQFHLVAGLDFYAPTGSYVRKRIINIGTNRWAVEPDVGITWMDEERHRQLSLFVGYTINRENTATHYRSGDEFHADFVAAQHFRNSLILGVAGYAVQQTTADSGSGAMFGAYRGRVIGLGPLIGWTFALGKLPINFSGKYVFEFDAQNRSTGDELWLTGNFRF